TLGISGPDLVTLTGPISLGTGGNGGHFDVSSAAGAVITGPMSGILSKDGTGPLTVTTARLAWLFVNQGTMRIAPGGGTAGSCIVGSLSISTSNGAKLDLNDHNLINDYPFNTSSPLSTVEGLIRTAYHSGDWAGAGITSSAAVAAVGSAHPTAL